jgi:hypothetical protein
MLLSSAVANAQINVANQINTIPANFSAYANAYLSDLTGHQGFAFLNNLNTTGDVLKKWELSFSLKIGAGLSTDYSSPDFTQNFEITGGMPTLFGTQKPGKLVFQFMDEGTGVPVVNPFTGDNLGFGLPLFPGLGTSIGISPALLPVFSLGLGYGTEVSVGVLPGAIKMATKGIANNFSISKDIMATIGIRHDAFNWVPVLHDRKFYLSLGINYSLISLGAAVGADLIGEIDAPSTDKIEVTNNLSGLNYKSSNLGLEAVLTKKFGFLDLSLFSSWNQSNYKLLSDGGIDIKIAKSFYTTVGEGSDTYSVANLIDLNQKNSHFIYGLALQFNLGRFNLALKAAPLSGHYYSLGLGYKILKEKKA